MSSELAHLLEGPGRVEDGRASLSLRELDSRFRDLEGVLAAAGVDPTERVALRPGNTAASVVAILYFLTRERAVALLPPHAATPGSCRALLEPSDDALGLRLTVSDRSAARGATGVAVLTSGSLGTPKIALHGHAELVENARACVRRLGLTSADRVAIPVPVFHMYGLGAALLPAVLAGASVDVQERSNVVKYVARERAFDPTAAFLTPTYARLLFAARHAPRPYRVTVVAGDKLPRPALEAYEARHGVVCPLYGSTELGAIAAAAPDDGVSDRATSVGRPLDGVEIAFGEAAGAGENAQLREIHARHAAGFRGYLRENGVLEARGGEPFPTRDLGELSPTGHLRLAGRADHAVKRDGVLVMLADLEVEIGNLPGVGAAVVVKGEDTARGAALIACVAPAGLDAAYLRGAAARALPSYAVPDRFVILEALPLTGSGKPDRAALRERYGA